MTRRGMRLVKAGVVGATVAGAMLVASQAAFADSWQDQHLYYGNWSTCQRAGQYQVNYQGWMDYRCVMDDRGKLDLWLLGA